jgi:hypothetical protein
MTDRPPQRKIITDFSSEHKSHPEQLQAMANDLLKHMRSSMTDPKMFKTYAESFAIVSKLLGDDLPTEKKHEQLTDTSAFEADS